MKRLLGFLFILAITTASADPNRPALDRGKEKGFATDSTQKGESLVFLDDNNQPVVTLPPAVAHRWKEKAYLGAPFLSEPVWKVSSPGYAKPDAIYRFAGGIILFHDNWAAFPFHMKEAKSWWMTGPGKALKKIEAAASRVIGASWQAAKPGIPPDDGFGFIASPTAKVRAGWQADRFLKTHQRIWLVQMGDGLVYMVARDQDSGQNLGMNTLLSHDPLPTVKKVEQRPDELRLTYANGKQRLIKSSELFGITDAKK